jgi:ATP adenylyltransferase
MALTYRAWIGLSTNKNVRETVKTQRPTRSLLNSPGTYATIGLLGEEMNQLWSPWRMNYIMNHDKGDDCVFCEALKKEDNQENLVFYRGREAFLILNRYPYTSGHVMAVPYAHMALLEELPASTRCEIIELAAQAVQVLRVLYKPDGFNLGINMGEAAGAGIANHIHMHVVPRWAGDTNFMSSLAQTRVLPESLSDSYRRICVEWTAQFMK